MTCKDFSIFFTCFEKVLWQFKLKKIKRNMKVGLMQNVNTIKALSNKWEILNFKQVLKDSSGGNIKIKTKDTLNEGVLPVVDQGKDFVCGYTNNVLAKVKANLPLIVFGDHTRNLKYIDFDFAMGADGTKILEVICPDALPRFIYYYLTSIEIVNTGYNRHFKFIKDLVFPLPPLTTQKRIAEILDNAAALRDKTQQLLTEYDQLAQSIFLDMFGDPSLNKRKWDKKKCGDYISYLADIGSNGANKTVSEKLKMSDEVDYAIMIRTTNFTKNDFENNIKYVSKEVYDFFKKSQIFGGEIIMNKIGSAGDFWLMPFLDKPVSLGLNQFVIRLEDINTIYFYYFLSTDYGRLNIKSKVNGVATKSITKTAVRDLPILVPPINLQNQFAEKIALIEQQKDLAKQELQESEDLFQALLQKAFKGELVD